MKKEIGGSRIRERGQCKGDEKTRSKREQGETENQRQEGQAKRWSEWFESAPCRVCDGLSLHKAQLMQQAHSQSNSENQCY